MFNFFVMFLVVMLSFSSGFYTLYKDPIPLANADLRSEMEVRPVSIPLLLPPLSLWILHPG